MAATALHKESLIRTAMRLFRRQGYASTGLNQILAESGAPKGSLYHYFPGGKEELAVAAVTLAGSMVKQLLEDQRQQILILATLRESTEDRLEDAELQRAEDAIIVINKKIQQLGELSHSVTELNYDLLWDSSSHLLKRWLNFYRSYTMIVIILKPRRMSKHWVMVCIFNYGLVAKACKNFYGS